MNTVLQLNDLLLLILNYATNTGKSYKICREVCINWQKLCDLYFDNRVDQYSNHLLTLMGKFPKLQLYIFSISANPNISWQYICDHPELHWSWSGLCANPNINWEIIKNHFLNKIAQVFISFNPNITEDIIKSTSFGETKINWNGSHMADHALITYKFVKENPQYNWNYFSLVMNPNITEEDLINITVDYNIPPEFYAYNPCCSWELLKKYTTVRPESYTFWLSSHPNVTWDIIIQNSQIKWNWNMVSRNPNITWDIIQQNPQYNWDYVQFSLNPNLTWRIVVNNPQICWDWNYISMNVFNKFNPKSIPPIYQKT